VNTAVRRTQISLTPNDDAMSKESERLMEHIAGLPDRDLLRMAYLDYAQCRSEAITYAKAEIAKRGVNTYQVDLRWISGTTVSHPFIIWIQRFWQFISMIVQTRAYAVGFVTGFFVFILLNILSYGQMMRTASDYHPTISFGFPLDWYTFGGYFGMTYIHWWNVVANIIACIFLCLISGWLFRNLIEKIRFYIDQA
jgi:hypothetical protein